MNNYAIVGRVGQGAHGYVLKALNRTTDDVVALKKINFKNLVEGIPKNVMREIAALRVLNSEHVKLTTATQSGCFYFISGCAAV